MVLVTLINCNQILDYVADQNCSTKFYATLRNSIMVYFNSISLCREAIVCLRVSVCRSGMIPDSRGTRQIMAT